MKKMSLTFGLVAALMIVGTVAAQADTKDAWLSTKAKIVLLTMDGLSTTAVKVDTVGGNVTIHGKVGSASDKARAEETIRKMDGVKDVKNLLQVVAPSQKKTVDAKDSDVKDRVEASLKAAKTMDDIKVASVNNGVVLLSGKTQSLGQKLLAIERVYTVNGVNRVASEIETVEN